jgi:hypothetical protein
MTASPTAAVEATVTLYVAVAVAPSANVLGGATTGVTLHPAGTTIVTVGDQRAMCAAQRSVGVSSA